MDLSTTYMGAKLKSPVVMSAGPLTREPSNIRAAEDAGVGAIVFHSLFEEEITHEIKELHHHLSRGTDSFPEALDYFPEPEVFHRTTDDYMRLIQKAKDAVDIPIIGSLNGSTRGGWIEYARKIETAGADALELNIYHIPTDPDLHADAVEQLYVDDLIAVKSSVEIPVAVKLSPFFSSMANMAKRLDEAGADALVLFNRFYQPDIDLETLEVVPHVLLSTPMAMRLPMRWVALLHGRIKADLAGSGGIHSGEDVLKMLLVGANVTMMTSALLKNGLGHIWRVLGEVREWMEKNEYESVAQMQGSCSQRSSPDPSAFERANYVKALNTF